MQKIFRELVFNCVTVVCLRTIFPKDESTNISSLETIYVYINIETFLVVNCFCNIFKQCAFYIKKKRIYFRQIFLQSAQHA